MMTARYVGTDNVLAERQFCLFAVAACASKRLTLADEIPNIYGLLSATSDSRRPSEQLTARQAETETASLTSSNATVIVSLSPEHHQTSPITSALNEPHQEGLKVLRKHTPFAAYDLEILPSMSSGPAGKKVPQLRRMSNFESSPTPDLDDTPYILFAIEQLTRTEVGGAGQRRSTPLSQASYPVERLIPDQGLGYLQSIRNVRGPSVVEIPPSRTHSSTPSSVRISNASTANAESYTAVPPPRRSHRYPDLTYKPMILRTFSLLFLCLLCLMMITALLFCAIYSAQSNGIMNYDGGFHQGFYFVFRYLPQLLAAFIFLYVRAVLSAVARVVLFMMMASEPSSRPKREDALFLRLYSSLLVPRFDLFTQGQWLLGFGCCLLWSVVFTIPIQSALFVVAPSQGTYRWFAAQGIAWTLVAIYAIVLGGAISIMISLFRTPTGLLWDIKCLADIVSLLPRSNNLSGFQDTEILSNVHELRQALPPRADRLGYWRTADYGPGSELFHALGEASQTTRRSTKRLSKSGASVHQDSLESLEENGTFPRRRGIFKHRATDSSLMAKVYSPAIRFRHIPWCLRDSLVIFYPVAFIVLYIALLVVSFLQSTSLSRGFPPLVPGPSDAAGFSPAAFLYSFLPSLVGMLLHFGLNGIAATVAVLMPWAEMNNPLGATPQKSLLLDYAHSMAIPFGSILSALRNKHFLMAAFAILTPVSLIIPVIAGGMFFPMTAQPSNTLLMFPDLTAFCIILAILGLIALLLSALPFCIMGKNRTKWRFPHGMNCLAEILSFLYASGILDDATFRNITSKADMRARLLTAGGTLTGDHRLAGRLAGGRYSWDREKRPSGGEQWRGGADSVYLKRYFFGVFKGRDGRSHLGVERVGRGLSTENVGRGQRGDFARSKSHFSL